MGLGAQFALQKLQAADDRSGSMLLKKDYEEGLLATLIQDQEQMQRRKDVLTS